MLLETLLTKTPRTQHTVPPPVCGSNVHHRRPHTPGPIRSPQHGTSRQHPYTPGRSISRDSLLPHPPLANNRDVYRPVARSPSFNDMGFSHSPETDGNINLNQNLTLLRSSSPSEQARPAPTSTKYPEQSATVDPTAILLDPSYRFKPNGRS